MYQKVSKVESVFYYLFPIIILPRPTLDIVFRNHQVLILLFKWLDVFHGVRSCLTASKEDKVLSIFKEGCHCFVPIEWIILKQLQLHFIVSNSLNIWSVKFLNGLKCILENLISIFKLNLQVFLNFIPLVFKYLMRFLNWVCPIIVLYEFIDRCLQTLVSNELRFLIAKFRNELVNKRLPWKNVLS